ncbi:MAG: chromate transporter, partial [Erysipelothrix sp.]|nr:chromate transporter [Erysipelothrix sp.]
MKTYKELFKIFSKLGVIAFGGPAAHIAMLEEEIVRKRNWVTYDKFIELLSITNFVPGPNSSEMVLGLGYYIAGYPGLFIAGISFIFPAMILTMILTLFLNQLNLELIEAITLSFTPILTVIIFKALTNLIKKQNKGYFLIILSIAFKFLGLSEVLILTIIAMTYALNEYRKLYSIDLLTLFLAFLKIGGTLYGSGYVLLSYLKTTFIQELNILSETQLIQAFSIGELTPGPVFTTATALGTMLFGFKGGIIATLGIFLPSFIIMILILPISEYLLKNKLIKTIIDGVGLAALGLMMVVVYDLLYLTIFDVKLVFLLLLNLYFVFKTKLNVP